MTPIERLARALCRSNGENADAMRVWHENGERRYSPGWYSRVIDAKAALRAMREPSAAMAQAGAYAIPAREEEGPVNPDDARDCWETMIDAALEEDIPPLPELERSHPRGGFQTKVVR